MSLVWKQRENNGQSKGMSAACPGFKPQGHRPLKCRRCYKDFNEHNVDLPPVSDFGVYRIRRGSSLSTLELDHLGSAANLTSAPHSPRTPRLYEERPSEETQPRPESSTSVRAEATVILLKKKTRSRTSLDTSSQSNHVETNHIEEKPSVVSRRPPFASSRSTNEESESLKHQLKEKENVIKQLQTENEDIRKEVKNLTQEVEELHDSFREDHTAEFRNLKKDLESAIKNTRVLEYKLRKSERYAQELEADLTETQKKVKEMTDIKSMTRNTSKPGTPSLSSQKEKEYKEALRNLQDTMEREKDLQEQLKYAEEETKTVRKKLQTTEQENEILVNQVRKLALKKQTKSKEPNDTLKADQMKIHLDLYEEEMSVMRTRTASLEKEKESLVNGLKSIQEDLLHRITALQADNERLGRDNKKMQLKMSMMSHSQDMLNKIGSRSNEKLRGSRESLTRSRENLSQSSRQDSMLRGSRESLTRSRDGLNNNSIEKKPADIPKGVRESLNQFRDSFANSQSKEKKPQEIRKDPRESLNRIKDPRESLNWMRDNLTPSNGKVVHRNFK